MADTGNHNNSNMNDKVGGVGQTTITNTTTNTTTSTNSTSDKKNIHNSNNTHQQPITGTTNSSSGAGITVPLRNKINKKPKKKRSKEGKDDVDTAAAATGSSTKNDGQQKKKKQKIVVAKKQNRTGGASAGEKAATTGTGTGTGTITGTTTTTTASGGGFQLFEGLSPAQQAAQEQMRRALEEDQYSAVGSIVDTESEDDDTYCHYRNGHAIRLDKSFFQQTVRKLNMLERVNYNNASLMANGNNPNLVDEDYYEDDDDDDDQASGSSSGNKRGNSKPKQPKKKRKDEISQLLMDDIGTKNTATANVAVGHTNTCTLTTSVSTRGGGGGGGGGGAVGSGHTDPFMLDGNGMVDDDLLDREGGSIFGATAGSSNSTWVECDKCKKWRRLRGVVDEKKLPSKWYCSMNKNDPDRARCSAPEEEYETPHTPETAADARTRKHLRVWVRRLQCNEAYEARLPTLTRGKKRVQAAAVAAASSSSSSSAAVTNTANPNSNTGTNNTSKDNPYEWVRCCNPSCGKWRAILRIMDAKTNVIDRVNAVGTGEWFCVMNTWDEKTASCAAPQENLPAIGCPPWVLQDE